jgi:hypothetical protein
MKHIMNKKERALQDQNDFLRELIEGIDQIKAGKIRPFK